MRRCIDIDDQHRGGARGAHHHGARPGYRSLVSRGKPHAQLVDAWRDPGRTIGADLARRAERRGHARPETAAKQAECHRGVARVRCRRDSDHRTLRRGRRQLDLQRLAQGALCVGTKAAAARPVCALDTQLRSVDGAVALDRPWLASPYQPEAPLEAWRAGTCRRQWERARGLGGEHVRLAHDDAQRLERACRILGR
eukprot:scaffold89910_cov26-Tisochrysis_lutea.AAC.4